ncbi:C6 transcription factor [Colletotrichum higginsianum IMI 349063]|uniref:C6 transcription factor n=1 Tax=Colletotrichum higginsianum (strain IMI 349063) TaxID=759273 RepID=A0A1B7YSX6_COLHI|nr:C6 transcription factor [Colletotrichum higginsianum IMI 349063]OBR15054.1 C6 transcription factor [Colletotrichum higginsianum IMI 349063]
MATPAYQVVRSRRALYRNVKPVTSDTGLAFLQPAKVSCVDAHTLADLRPYRPATAEITTVPSCRNLFHPTPGDEDFPLLPRNLLPCDSRPTLSNLVPFRCAVGFNTAGSGPYDDSDTEAGRAAALGIYTDPIAAHRRIRTLRILTTVVVCLCV